MNETDIKDILELDSEERYNFFLSGVADERDIWILVSDDQQFLKIYLEEDDIEYLPVWPTIEMAQHYCDSVSEKLVPKAITVPIFFSKWVAGLTGDDIKVGAVPNVGSDVWVVEPDELKAELQQTFANLS